MSDTFTQAPLVPELCCSDFPNSVDFYTRILGFDVLYDRPESKFAYLTRDHAQIMLQQTNEWWNTGELHPPYGRGINFQIQVSSAQSLSEHIKQNGIPLFGELETNWYRKDDTEIGVLEFLVQDPDGYLLRFSERLNPTDLKTTQ
jgi:catechol 2,3-dioxygenase-like lactoylglutathione lyase family enzyme